MSDPKTPIDALLDALEWRELDPQATWHEGGSQPGEIPVATHEGVLDVMGHQLRVYQLSDGRRVIAAEDLERFFLGMAEEGGP